ncbi:MAG TPA: hypothetical protein PKB09_00210 [Candidatus Saccharibacteria bacterium]|nr:hypothetical protein [Candidatus Saccharibacteria bacterium]
MQHIKNGINRIYDFTSSGKFFWLVVVFFIINTVWGAVSFIYPMVFDEYAHYGMTSIYAQQWSPFISEQPPEASLFGDITRDPSYLYSYLLSFPYRLFNLFIKSETGLIIALRFLNISLVVAGIALYKKLFDSWKITPRSINVVLLAFASTMIVPLIATHINYDNLMFLMSANYLILGTNILRQKGNLLTQSTLFVSVGLLTTLVKHNFLPIFIISFFFISITFWNKNGRRSRQLLVDAWKARPNGLVVTCLVALLLVSTGLFIERHVQNLVRYKTVAPMCDRIQPEYVCEDFGPWYRNRNNLQNKSSDVLYGNPLSFTQHWTSKIMRGYFAPFSHTPTEVVSEHEPFGPIVRKAISPPQIIFAYVVLVAGLLSTLIYFKKLWAKTYIRLSILVSAIYIVVLWLFNFQLYQKLGVAQAVQARYIYPILLLVFLVFIEAFKYSIHSEKQRKILLVLFFTFYIWGGGIVGYLIRADSLWYWQNRTVVQVNTYAQNVLKHIVIH